MVEDELLFYFGTTSANRIPQYELIKFPSVTGIKRLQFTAFNRWVSRHWLCVVPRVYSVRCTDFWFGRYYNLNFVKNDKLLSPEFKWYVVDGQEYYEMQGAHQSCHYLHLDGEAVAAFSFCEEYIVSAGDLVWTLNKGKNLSLNLLYCRMVWFSRMMPFWRSSLWIDGCIVCWRETPMKRLLILWSLRIWILKPLCSMRMIIVRIGSNFLRICKIIWIFNTKIDYLNTYFSNARSFRQF